MFIMTNLDVHTKVGTLGGTLFAVILQIHAADITKIVVTGICAGVSYGVSLALKELVKWLRHRRQSGKTGN